MKDIIAEKEMVYYIIKKEKKEEQRRNQLCLEYPKAKKFSI